MEKNRLSFLDRQSTKKTHIITRYIIIHSKFLVDEENVTSLTGERNCNMRDNWQRSGDLIGDRPLL